jgi:hypothetical protein
LRKLLIALTAQFHLLREPTQEEAGIWQLIHFSLLD